MTALPLMTVARLIELLAGAAPDAEVQFVVHNPVGCCDDPHVHDVPDIYAEDVTVDARNRLAVIRLDGFCA